MCGDPNEVEAVLEAFAARMDDHVTYLENLLTEEGRSGTFALAVASALEALSSLYEPDRRGRGTVRLELLGEVDPTLDRVSVPDLRYMVRHSLAMLGACVDREGTWDEAFLPCRPANDVMLDLHRRVRSAGVELPDRLELEGLLDRLRALVEDLDGEEAGTWPPSRTVESLQERWASRFSWEGERKEQLRDLGAAAFFGRARVRSILGGRFRSAAVQDPVEPDPDLRTEAFREAAEPYYVWTGNSLLPESLGLSLLVLPGPWLLGLLREATDTVLTRARERGLPAPLWRSACDPLEIGVLDSTTVPGTRSS